jgi:hypothetical protein
MTDPNHDSPVLSPFEACLADDAGGDVFARQLVDENRAIRSQTRGRELSAAGKLRYRRNRLIVSQVKRALTVSDLVLLQVSEEEQWREEFQTVEEFAEKYAGLSSSQFYKVLDSARVYQVFAEEGCLAERPKGRYVEELVKVVACEHWIAAWEFARDMCRDDGLSKNGVRDALRDYCRDRQLVFGRRAPNGTSFRLLAPEDASVEEPPEDGNWKNQLSVEQRSCLRRLVDPKVLEEVRAAFSTKPPEVIILDSLVGLPDPGFDAQDRQAWGGFLEFLRIYAPAESERLLGLMIASLGGPVTQQVLARCKKNRDAKAGYQRAKKGKSSKS